MIEIDGNKAIGFYRSVVDGDYHVQARNEMGVLVTLDWSDVPTATQDHLLRLAQSQGHNLMSSNWYLGLTEHDEVKLDPDQNKFHGDAQDDRDDKRDDEGTGGGDGSDSDGDSDGRYGEGDGDGESDDQSDDSEAEGDEVTDDDMTLEELERALENFDPKNARSPHPGEDDSTGSKIADEIWEKIKPNVEAVAESYTTYGTIHAMMNGKRGRDGKPGKDGVDGGGGKLVKVGPGPQRKIEGLFHHKFDKVLAAVARGVHIYLPGPPGTGKSHMVKQVSEALGIPFGVTSFSPQSTESKLLGFRNAHGETVRTVYRELYEHGGAFCGDELDNSNPAVVAVLNGGLANGFMEFPDGVVTMHPDFVFIATANTLGTGPTAEFAGRQKLDPATLNRFVKIEIDTDENMETQIVRGMLGDAAADKWLLKVRHVRGAVAAHRIKHFVTMRDSINGAKLIAPGAGRFTELEALEATVLSVLTDDQRAKIKAWKG